MVENTQTHTHRIMLLCQRNAVWTCEHTHECWACGWVMLKLTGEPNDKILYFTEGLAEYTKQLVSYVGFNTDEKPWPFGDWPDV